MSGRDQSDDEEAAGRAEDRERDPQRTASDRDPGRRADYRIEQGLTPEERELLGEPGDDGEASGGHGAGGSYAPTAEEATGRRRPRSRGPGAWFGRAPAPATAKESHRDRGPDEPREP